MRLPTVFRRAPHFKSAPSAARGFTLLELIVVIAILAMLATFVVPAVLGNLDDAKQTKAKGDITMLMQQLKIYKVDNGRYPTAEQGLQALVSKPTSGPIPQNWKPYLDKAVPKDPWGTPYQYLNPGFSGQGVDVMSYGEDGQEGGEGNNADIGSWQ